VSLEQSAIPTFANHQTFHPRFGWIKKGFDAATEDPDVFNRADAPVILGVGKNMVEAIRFWCIATGVLQRQPNPDRPRMSIAVPTQLGQALLADGGLDPFMEDATTLWILHWRALSAPTLLPVWWSAFNDFTALEFTEAELLHFCIDEVANTTWSQPNPSSIRKDVDCLLRMYTSRDTRGRQTLDELLDSPFRELGIISPSPSGTDAYRFVRGAKPSLTPVAVTYACLDYMAMTEPGARTASLTRLTADPGSPGRILKLTEDVVLTALEWAADVVVGVGLASPSGTAQFVLDDVPELAALAAMQVHHQARGRNVLDLPAGSLAGPGARLASTAQVAVRDVAMAASAPRKRANRGSAA